MRFQSSIYTSFFAILFNTIIHATPLELAQRPFFNTATLSRNLSTSLFGSLEELSRIVDISYCVGVTGIYHPFTCASRCHEFPHFELVDTWNTGPLMSDSCGYIAIDHGHNGEAQGHGKGRIIVAFRGTYSLANTIVDLSTIPQEYVEYPADPDEPANPPPAKNKHSFRHYLPWPFHRFFSNAWISGLFRASSDNNKGEKCTNCTVHTGFYTSYIHTRRIVIPHLERLKTSYPDYDLHLVGHSLGGAVAALMSLESENMGWNPTVTTFGEPRFGNKALIKFLDKKFGLGDNTTLNLHGRYRRVTHVDDPVPLLPLREWGYRMHAGEIFISKAELSPTVSDLMLCRGDEDEECIAGAEEHDEHFNRMELVKALSEQTDIASNFGIENMAEFEAQWGFPTRFKLWQLFFAHRDYFWRLGLCVPGGDPLDWGRQKYPHPKESSYEEL